MSDVADFVFAVDLRLDVPVEIGEDEQSLYDPFWNSPIIDDNLGVVALSPEFVKEKNLPPTQVFPWDETKGIYILSFHHSLHCLVSSPNIYKSSQVCLICGLLRSLTFRSPLALDEAVGP